MTPPARMDIKLERESRGMGLGTPKWLWRPTPAQSSVSA
jgi:hypothetical protein